MRLLDRVEHLPVHFYPRVRTPVVGSVPAAPEDEGGFRSGPLQERRQGDRLREAIGAQDPAGPTDRSHGRGAVGGAVGARGRARIGGPGAARHAPAGSPSQLNPSRGDPALPTAREQPQDLRRLPAGQQEAGRAHEQARLQPGQPGRTSVTHSVGSIT